MTAKSPDSSSGYGRGGTWRANVLTLLPEAFPGLLGLSLAGKALKNGIWSLEVVDIREFARDKHRSVDDAGFGGGPGMVMRPDILAAAIDHTVSADRDAGCVDSAREGERPLIYLSPRGARFDQAMAQELADGPGVTLICGRFEGVDERVIQARAVREVSLGDFVLSGGETAAQAVVDAVVRLLPGVVGDPATLQEESFESGLLEYPHYTRPQEWEGLRVPDILLSGHHKEIEVWRQRQAEELTRIRRPDLWQSYVDAQRKIKAQAQDED